jgi:hypothetical protein
MLPQAAIQSGVVGSGHQLYFCDLSILRDGKFNGKSAPFPHPRRFRSEAEPILSDHWQNTAQVWSEIAASQSGGAPGSGGVANSGRLGVGADGVDQYRARIGQKSGHKTAAQGLQHFSKTASLTAPLGYLCTDGKFSTAERMLSLQKMWPKLPQCSLNQPF